MARLRCFFLASAVAGLGLAGVLPRPAHGACQRVDVWVTWSPDHHRHYVTPWTPGSCSPVPVPPGWTEAAHPSGWTGVGFLPPGVPSGFGYDGSVASP